MASGKAKACKGSTCELGIVPRSMAASGPLPNLLRTLGPGDPAEPPSDDDSTQAVWGDPGDQDVLEVTHAQELLYWLFWRSREEERVQWEEVD